MERKPQRSDADGGLGRDYDMHCIRDWERKTIPVPNLYNLPHFLHCLLLPSPLTCMQCAHVWLLNPYGAVHVAG
jgi:hypothetical protein